MAAPGGFRVNCPAITHQTIDGEVVIVNLESGCYYSLRKTGAEIWSFLDAGAGVSEIVAHLQGRYRAFPEAIDAAVKDLVGELHQESILIPDPAPAHGNGRGLCLDGEAAPASPDCEFEPPVLQKFTDMRDLLLLDPIHEVDEMGWPNMKPAA